MAVYFIIHFNFSKTPGLYYFKCFELALYGQFLMFLEVWCIFIFSSHFGPFGFLIMFCKICIVKHDCV